MNKNFLGFGLGLRSQHYEYILKNQPEVDWFEILSENYMIDGGKPMYYLDAFIERYPLVMHGVSMSIGSTDELNRDYLKKLKKLIKRVQPKWISDHMCWTAANNVNSHDLLPLPYTEESITHLVNRINQVQDFLEQPILLENVSSYLTYQESQTTEWDFLNEITRRSGCLLLLDLNNIYVSSRNHGFDAKTFIDQIDPQSVQQFHLAGHSDFGTHVIDTHDHDVCQSVWDLYDYALDRFGAISTMIERDDNIPDFPELLAEMNQARQIAQSKNIQFKSVTKAQTHA